MSGNLLVSAIIPTYNRAHIVCDAVESVLAQTYPYLEVIVVDDGSTDSTLEVLQRYGGRIRVVSQENAGPASARNRGVAASNGDLIAFLDSDDVWLPAKLGRQVTLLSKLGDSVPCCLCNILMRWGDREFASFDRAWLNPNTAEGVWLNVDEVLATRFVLFNQGAVIRHEVLAKIGGFDESLRFMEDYDLPLRLSLEGPWAFIREPLVIWRETKASWYRQSQREHLCQKACTLQVFERLSAQVGDKAGCERLRRCVAWELKRARRQLWAARIGQMGFRGATLVARSIRMIERLRRGTYRRSAWFPQMEVRSVEHWQCGKS